MSEYEHTAILKRVGRVLVVIGIADIAAMIYCLLHHIDYGSAFNIFAVIAGILLVKGSLRTAAYVRWVALLMLTVAIGFVLAVPFLQPIGLTAAEIRLNPGRSGAVIAAIAFTLALLYWIAQALNRPPVLAAASSAGVSRLNARTPVSIGATLIALMLVSILLGGDGKPEEHAKALASQEVGPGYQFYIDSLRTTYNSKTTSVSAIVTAWNDKEVRDIPVHWEE